MTGASWDRGIRCSSKVNQGFAALGRRQAGGQVVYKDLHLNLDRGQVGYGAKCTGQVGPFSTALLQNGDSTGDAAFFDS
jgi:hypothetical protein